MSSHLRANFLKLVGLLSFGIVTYFIFWPGLSRQAALALETPDRYELLSLDPNRPEVKSPTDFHGFPILGSTIISDVTVQRQLNRALANAAGSFLATGSACFSPRHGIRVTRGAEVTEFAICFECNRVKAFRGNVTIAHWITSNAPETVFNATLTKAGLPLAPK